MSVRQVTPFIIEPNLLENCTTATTYSITLELLKSLHYMCIFRYIYTLNIYDNKFALLSYSQNMLVNLFTQKQFTET